MKLFENISLRPLQAGDAQEMYGIIDAQREHLGRWLPFVETTFSVADTQEFVDYALEDENLTFTIRKGDQFIGLIGLKATDKENRKTEIGYWLSQNEQRKGIMTCAVETLCNYAFFELDLNRIQIKCAVGNSSSSNIPKRLGFSFEGIERAGELFPDGRFTNLEIYSLLKNEYQPTEKK